MKILIVDDSSVMRKILLRTLRQAGFDGHEFAEAVNGADGLEKVKSEDPDVVISDWNMPEMTGIDFLRSLRSEGIDKPFGFVTTEGSPTMRQTAIEGGANFFIEKPFTPETLEKTMGEFIK